MEGTCCPATTLICVYSCTIDYANLDGQVMDDDGFPPLSRLLRKSMPDAKNTDRFLALPAVKTAVGLCRSAIYARVKNGTFPSPVKIGRGSRWSEAEIRDWQDSQLAKRDARAA